MINYFSIAIVPAIIFMIIAFALSKKIKVFDTFLIGANYGLNIIVKILPSIVGLFVAIGLLRASGTLNLIGKLLYPVTKLLQIPQEILTLMLIKPISGSAALSVVSDIFKTYGVDSLIGKTASVITGATETTLYVVSIYFGYIGVKNIKYVLYAALIADFVGMLTAIIVCKFYF